MILVNLLDAEGVARKQRSIVKRRSYERSKADPRRAVVLRETALRAMRRTSARHAELKKLPCKDCGKRFPTCCMDFDHRDPSQKASHMRYRAVVTIRKELREAELAKCDLVCSNCHRIREAQRKGSPTAEKWWTDG